MIREKSSDTSGPVFTGFCDFAANVTVLAFYYQWVKAEYRANPLSTAGSSLILFKNIPSFTNSGKKILYQCRFLP